jgi:alkylhydroperoxidase family enzyme
VPPKRRHPGARLAPESGRRYAVRVSDAEPTAWIRVIGEDTADGELALLYDELRSPQTGAVDSILKVHSLHPRSMRDHVQLYRTLMHGQSGITRPEREMIGVVVSALNRCHY